MDGPCDKRRAELQLGRDRNLIGAKTVVLRQQQEVPIAVDGRKSVVSFSKIGKLEQMLDQPRAEKKDFILLNLRRESGRA
ncbi:hypothetical protein [Herbaspirillum huttiense]|uniref:hypothetical protein n=1 Tax=Herbaspirillum huttiense TaxID=863372 RepID=UPI0039B09DCE